MEYIKLFEQYNKKYNVGDIVLIEYWYGDYSSEVYKLLPFTPVKIIDKIGRKYKVSHDNEYSNIKNAPDELIKKSDIVDFYKNKNNNE